MVQQLACSASEVFESVFQRWDPRYQKFADIDIANNVNVLPQWLEILLNELTSISSSPREGLL